MSEFRHDGEKTDKSIKDYGGRGLFKETSGLTEDHIQVRKNQRGQKS